MVTQVGCSVVGWSRCQVMPCAVGTVHEEREFLGWASKSRSMVCQWFGLKTTRTVSSGLASKLLAMVSFGLASKLVAMIFCWFSLKIGQRFLLVWPQNRWWKVFRFGPQNWQLWFSNLGIKITAMVSWVGHQNQTGYSLSVAPQNRREHASRSSGLLHVEASRARVSQFASKLTEARRRVVHVAPSRMLH
jgi:hypothetical protein